ncbi:MAG: phosphopyruvate hydratase [Clostridiales bacterium]|nr:phosphopyruvate hydratase [Candidatus Equinaster intestinalis]
MINVISKVKGIEAMDSRGNPTVMAVVELSNGDTGVALAPSGASTGVHEAHEKRDGDTSRYHGKGVLEAVSSVNERLAEVLKGTDCSKQYEIDRKMIEADGTENKSNLGANAILAVSLACAKAAAKAYNMPLYKYLGGINSETLPRPMMNILNGGAHAGNNIDIQEFMIIPVAAESFAEGLRGCSEIYHTLGKILKKYNTAGVGDEGGFAPDLENDTAALDVICEAIEKSGYSSDEFKIALDVASSEWYTGDGIYRMPKRNTDMNGEELIAFYEKLVNDYPIVSIEDGVAEDDFEGWRKLTNRLGSKIQLVGDDLFVTNSSRLSFGIKEKMANAILVKPNQIGTLSETLNVIRMAQKNNYATIISHRSGETEDTTIADIAVATNAGQIKTGAPCRSDRVAKYNRLLMIEKELCSR